MGTTVISLNICNDLMRLKLSIISPSFRDKNSPPDVICPRSQCYWVRELGLETYLPFGKVFEDNVLHSR